MFIFKRNKINNRDYINSFSHKYNSKYGILWQEYKIKKFSGF